MKDKPTMHFGVAISAATAAVVLLGGLSSGPFSGIAMAFAQTSDAGTQGNTTNTLQGVISSIQIDDETTPAWITAGEWTLTSDRPLFNNANNNTGSAEAQILGFDAILYMVSYANGTGFHKHTISNFSQTEVVYEGANSTTINGTFTITDADGVAQNVEGFISLWNDKISIFVDPTEIQDHFGPRPIAGMILLPPERTPITISTNPSPQTQ
ncbi:MAG: hypothetical protein M3115_00465 [Thermoproteota archaeon]|nr:hypothetical protein [Thermoproteota archaeon]